MSPWVAVKEKEGKAGSSRSDTDLATRSVHKPDCEVGKKAGIHIPSQEDGLGTSIPRWSPTTFLLPEVGWGTVS